MNRERAIQELNFKAVRSSGAGGQHVNKVSTKVELNFNIENSSALSLEEKKRIFRKLGNRITKEGVLQLQCSDTRSQHKNKELVIQNFIETLENALKRRKKRRKTKPSRSSIERRLKSKKEHALKKANRSKPDLS